MKGEQTKSIDDNSPIMVCKTIVDQDVSETSGIFMSDSVNLETD